MRATLTRETWKADGLTSFEIHSRVKQDAAKGRLTSTGTYFVRLVVSTLILAHFPVCRFSFRWEILRDVVLLHFRFRLAMTLDDS